MQRFHADKTETFTNGAIGWRSSSEFDCLGPFAKVQNCPIKGTDLRLTCYATSHADTYFSVPAVTRHRGQRIKGYFAVEDGACVFVPMSSQRSKLPMLATN